MQEIAEEELGQAMLERGGGLTPSLLAETPVDQLEGAGSDRA